MECNKDEAKRAKEISEKKFIAKDIAGAKKFALKAQSLYPGIEGVPWMLTTFDVYIAVENKVNGESDWYGILGASPRDDDETMKRKFKKLALLLHPDKNRFIGAEGAFKHVSEAWKFLSDKEKRAAYDRKRGLRTVDRKASVPSADGGFCNFEKSSFVKIPKNNVPKPAHTATNGSSTAQKAGQACRKTSSSFTAKQGSSTAVPGPPNRPKLDAFWTICPKCMSGYKYFRIYANRSVLCANCRQKFLAVERPLPGMSTNGSSCSQKQNQKSATGNSASSSATHAASGVQRAHGKVKKEREEVQTAARKDDYMLEKNARRRSAEFSPGNAPKRAKVSETCGSKVTYKLRSFANGSSGAKKAGQAGSATTPIGIPMPHLPRSRAH